MEITVIDHRDLVGWLASASRLGEVYMTDVRSMVTNVIAKAGSKLITRLNILDHGNSTGIQIGSNFITTTTLSTFEPTLLLLRPKFDKKGFVHLQHCQIGSNRLLLLGLSRIFNRTVYAGTGDHNPVYRFNWGNYNRALPSGVFQVKVGRP
jgi:hypothetical protein